MTLVHSILLGIVEGITEFLPISSTAHLQLASTALGLTQTDFVKSFEIIIQLGAILAVVVIYWRTLTLSTELWKRILTAFIPTGIIGFVLYKLIKQFLLGNTTLIIWTLGIGGVILIIFEYYFSRHDAERQSIRELETMSYSTAFLIGLAQSVAVIPGVSRAAATIIAGRVLGLGRKAIVEFSFLLAIPTMLAAAGYDFFKNASAFSASQLGVLTVGFITAFIAALITVKMLLRFVETHNFTWFGVYRILLAIGLFLYL